jgi:hypothetical protein
MSPTLLAPFLPPLVAAALPKALLARKAILDYRRFTSALPSELKETSFLRSIGTFLLIGGLGALGIATFLACLTILLWGTSLGDV